MYKQLFLTLLGTMVLCTTQARVRLPHLIGDNMIIQQNTEVRLWGWAAPGKEVRITTSWNSEVQRGVAAADRVFHPAVGYVRKKNLIYVVSPQVKHPVAVRYCFRNWQTGNVTNQALLPLFPFRTDNW